MCLIRIITDGKNYIDADNNPATYNGITQAAQSRLDYLGIDIGKIVYIPDGQNLVSQNILANVGEELIYQVKVKNTSGEDYKGFNIIENIDSKVSYEGFEIYENTDSKTQITQINGKDLKSNQVGWKISSLSAGEWVTIKYTVKVKKDKSLLGEVIESTGKVDNIATSRIETLIGNKLNEEEKSSLLDAFKGSLNNTLTERKFINQLYIDALELDIGLVKKDTNEELTNKDITRYYKAGDPPSGGREDKILSVKATQLKDTDVKKYVYNNFYGLRITRNTNVATQRLVKGLGQWNTQVVYEIKDRARTLTSNMLLEGDIILVYTDTEKDGTPTEDGNFVDKSYIYLENKLWRKISSSDFEEISGADLTVFLRNIVCDDYIILRPSTQIERAYDEDECSNAELHTTLEWTDNNDGTHTRICSACDYTRTEAHEGANHENNGKCRKCSAIYETHSKSEEIKEYIPTDNGHQIIYKCTNTNCDGTFEGEEQSHQLGEWIDKENGTHSAICTKCKYEVTETHNYGEDGICEECEAIQPTENCEHTYKQEKNETHHWNVCSKCQVAQEGSLELHKYGEYTDNEDGTHSAICTVCEYKLTEKHEGANHENNGQCIKCSAIYETHSQSEKIKEYKLTENGHKIIYECTVANCEETFEGEEEAHTVEKWADNGNGTHSAICTVCNNKLTEEHNENCTKCKKSDSTSGSEDNANGDNTVADKELPKAGMRSMILVLIISVGALIITKFKMKKYKDI